MQVKINGGRDTVTFADRLDSHSVNVIKKAMALIPQGPMRAAEVLATLSECYVIYGITSWTLPGEVTPESTRKILEHEDADLLIEAADEQYQEQVLLPLVKRASSSSQRSQTDASTSPTPSTGRKSTRRSRPSLTSITPTDGTDTTSSQPDGAYSSSQNLELAAS